MCVSVRLKEWCSVYHSGACSVLYNQMGLISNTVPLLAYVLSVHVTLPFTDNFSVRKNFAFPEYDQSELSLPGITPPLNSSGLFSFSAHPHEGV